MFTRNDPKPPKSFKHPANGDLVLPHDVPALLTGKNNHWTVVRKAIFVMAVKEGFFTAEEGCKKFEISPAEYADWDSQYFTHGLKGLKALLERDAPPQSDIPSGVLPEVLEQDFKLHDLCFEVEHFKVQGPLGAVQFTAQQWRVLRELVTYKGIVCSKLQVYEAMRGSHSKECELRGVDVRVCVVRQKLAEVSKEKYIETVWGRGYCFKN